MDKLIHNLVDLSNKWGRMPNHIQGAGGNFSIKAGNDLIIKASGFFLSEVSENQGLAKVDIQKMSSGLKNIESLSLSAKAKEEALSKLNIEASLPMNETLARPSMETAFHALFQNKVVMHTHSVAAMVLACRKNASEFAKSILSDAPIATEFVPYGNPGFGLYEKLKQAFQNSEAIPKAYILESHGILVHGESVQEAETHYSAITNYLEKALELTSFPTYQLIPNEENLEIEGDIAFQVLIPYMLNLNGDTCICPDQSIILKGKEGRLTINNGGRVNILAKERAAVAIAEISIACSYVLHIYEKQGVEPNFLTPNAIDLLHGMSSEKFRKAQIAS